MTFRCIARATYTLSPILFLRRPFLTLSLSLALCLSSFFSFLLHRCLGHHGESAFSALVSKNLIFHNKTDVFRSLCNACQLDKHSRLSFTSSRTLSNFSFQIIHANLWTSTVLSFMGFKFYVVLLNDFTHYT